MLCARAYREHNLLVKVSDCDSGNGGSTPPARRSKEVEKTCRVFLDILLSVLQCLLVVWKRLPRLRLSMGVGWGFNTSGLCASQTSLPKGASLDWNDRGN